MGISANAASRVAGHVEKFLVHTQKASDKLENLGGDWRRHEALNKAWSSAKKQAQQGTVELMHAVSTPGLKKPAKQLLRSAAQDMTKAFPTRSLEITEWSPSLVGYLAGDTTSYRVGNWKQINEAIGSMERASVKAVDAVSVAS